MNASTFTFECPLCDYGTYQHRFGSSACRRCGDGRFHDNTLNASVRWGTYDQELSIDDIDDAQVASRHEYTGNTPDRRVFLPKIGAVDRSECMCQRNFYAVEHDAYNFDADECIVVTNEPDPLRHHRNRVVKRRCCYSCPHNAHCEQGLWPPTADEGYWYNPDRWKPAEQPKNSVVLTAKEFGPTPCSKRGRESRYALDASRCLRCGHECQLKRAYCKRRTTEHPCESGFALQNCNYECACTAAACYETHNDEDPCAGCSTSVLLNTSIRSFFKEDTTCERKRDIKHTAPIVPRD